MGDSRIFQQLVYYGSVGESHPGVQHHECDAVAHRNRDKPGTSFGYPGATPSVSANGASNGIVWAVENNSPAVLHAYSATNLNELYNSNQAANGRDQFGAGNKFITPMIANGKVYVGTTNGVAVFGLLP